MSEQERKKMRTPEETARRFGMHHKTIRKWPAQGCPHHRAGRRLFFVDDEVDEWTARNGIAPSTTTAPTTEVANAAHQ